MGWQEAQQILKELSKKLNQEPRAKKSSSCTECSELKMINEVLVTENEHLEDKVQQLMDQLSSHESIIKALLESGAACKDITTPPP